MKGVIVDPKSPYYWIRYYDRAEPDPRKRRKKLNTKIEVTEADKKRFAEAKSKGLKVVLSGNADIRNDLKAFQRGLARRNIEDKAKIKLEFDKTLSEGYAEFKKYHSVPGSKQFLKEKTLINYTLAVNHMIAACKDKYIYKYDEDDYHKLLEYFERVKVPGKTIILDDGDKKPTFKKMSQNTRSNYTRSLRALWKYFCSKNYANRIIIESVDSEDKDPDPIPLDEMFTILNYLKADTAKPHHFNIIYFMLLTGCRPSSAIVQLKKDINFKQKYITIQNVKTGRRKNKLTFKFPLYNELEKLCKASISPPNDEARLFYQFKVNEVSYTNSMTFWERSIKVLNTAKSINNFYTLKQIRSTTASFLVNIKKMNAIFVQRLLDQTDQKVTERHYIEKNIAVLRDQLDDIEFENFLP